MNNISNSNADSVVNAFNDYMDDYIAVEKASGRNVSRDEAFLAALLFVDSVESAH